MDDYWCSHRQLLRNATACPAGHGEMVVMREIDGYRDTLADIVEVCGKRVLNTTDIVRYTGLCRKTVVKRYGKEDLAATAFARMLTSKKK